MTRAVIEPILRPRRFMTCVDAHGVGTSGQKLPWETSTILDPMPNPRRSSATATESANAARSRRRGQVRRSVPRRGSRPRGGLELGDRGSLARSHARARSGENPVAQGERCGVVVRTTLAHLELTRDAAVQRPSSFRVNRAQLVFTGGDNPPANRAGRRVSMQLPTSSHNGRTEEPCSGRMATPCGGRSRFGTAEHPHRAGTHHAIAKSLYNSIQIADASAGHGWGL